MKGKSLPKGQYLSWIWTYERRIEKMEKHVTEMYYKLKIWRQQVKKMEKREIEIIALGNAVALFTGKNVKNSIREKDLLQIRRIFFKYGLEHHMSGKDLSIYTGVNWETSKNVAQDNRDAFTKSFQALPENRELYHRFCQYMEHLGQESIENNSVKQ